MEEALHGGPQGDLGGLGERIGKELKAVLLLVISVAKDPGFYGISVEDWTSAAGDEDNGWGMIMNKIARLEGRSVGRVKAVMNLHDWTAVHGELEHNSNLRRLLLGLAVPPPRGETLLMWLPASLVQELHEEASLRNIKPSRIVLEALMQRYDKT
jgi:hypothetical protein